MINVDRTLSVNPVETPPELMLEWDDVWRGLVRKAENAVPYVAAITECKIIKREENGFIREVLLQGERLQERITFFPKDRVHFERLSGSAMGTIDNRIERAKDGSLNLRFCFDLELAGADAAAEAAFSAGMEHSYLVAVQTTLERIRSEKASALSA
jgi:hypothetical protein